jgi:hypothetical protein
MGCDGGVADSAGLMGCDGGVADSAGLMGCDGLLWHVHFVQYSIQAPQWI